MLDPLVSPALAPVSLVYYFGFSSCLSVVLLVPGLDTGVTLSSSCLAVLGSLNNSFLLFSARAQCIPVAVFWTNARVHL